MGVSTDALMAFGFDLGEELPESFTAYLGDDENGEGFEADEFLLRDYDAGIPEWTPDGPPDYWHKRSEALGKLPVEIIAHCSGEYPMYFLAVRGTECQARRGYPSEAVQRDIALREIGAMRAFCEKHGIEWQEPRWHIFSMWN
jgi:hypothetical protein